MMMIPDRDPDFVTYHCSEVDYEFWIKEGVCSFWNRNGCFIIRITDCDKLEWKTKEPDDGNWINWPLATKAYSDYLTDQILLGNDTSTDSI